MTAVQHPSHLAIVCCHGIWLGGLGRGANESEWLIAPFQAGETPTFVEHIKAGLRRIASDPDAVLMFSGGPTRRETKLSEAQSYADLARENNFFDIIPAAEARRILVEDRALDSYYNILFSIIQFWRVCGCRWPERVTVVSHAFKRARIVGGHCAAVGFPLERVEFVGIDPPGMAAGTLDKEGALKGVGLALGQWLEDPHGMGEALAGKRKARNPWNIGQDLFATEDERRQSGLATKRTEEGYEVLDTEAPRPWK